MKKRMFFYILTVIFMVMNVTTDAANFVTDGLVSYWTFDRTSINDGIAEDVWGKTMQGLWVTQKFLQVILDKD